MTTPERPAREFWIDLAMAHGDPYDFVSEGEPHDHPSSTNIHVIEYEPVMRLLEKALEVLDDAKKKLEVYYDQTSGEYAGGPESSRLISQIRATAERLRKFMGGQK